MAEPKRLLAAREHLSQAEARLRSEEGLFHLEEGLALLEEVMSGEASEFRSVARNLGIAYSTKICGTVKELVETDNALPEPDLEHFFKMVLAFDERGFELPEHARSTKINLARRLVDRYYEGYSAEEKQAALEQLAEISKQRPRR
jgi:hypothetical protein